jgi:hypothetical protein
MEFMTKEFELEPCNFNDSNPLFEFLGVKDPNVKYLINRLKFYEILYIHSRQSCSICIVVAKTLKLVAQKLKSHQRLIKNLICPMFSNINLNEPEQILAVISYHEFRERLKSSYIHEDMGSGCISIPFIYNQQNLDVLYVFFDIEQ